MSPSNSVDRSLNASTIDSLPPSRVPQTLVRALMVLDEFWKSEWTQPIWTCAGSKCQASYAIDATMIPFLRLIDGER